MFEIVPGSLFGRFLGPLLKTEKCPFMKNVLKTLAKSLLIPLRLTRAALATDAAVQNKIHSSRTTLIISDEEMEDMKIVKSLEESGLLIKGVTETIENDAKNIKLDFFSMLLDILGASLLGNLLAD